MPSETILALCIAGVSILFGAIAWLLIRKDTSARSMSTMRWTIALGLMIGILHVGVGVVLVFIDHWVIGIYIVARPLSWCLFGLLYFHYRKVSVPIILFVPDVYRVKTEKSWKTVVVFGVLIIGFCAVLGSIYMLVVQKYGVGFEALVGGILALGFGYALFRRWLTPGAIRIDKEQIQKWRGKTRTNLPWKDVNEIHLDELRIQYPGARADAVYQRVTVKSHAITIKVSEDETGLEELKRMYFVLLYYGKQANPYMSFTFQKELGKGWYNGFQPQLQKLLPEKYRSPSYDQMAGGTAEGRGKEKTKEDALMESISPSETTTKCPHCGKTMEYYTSICSFCYKNIAVDDPTVGQ